MRYKKYPEYKDSGVEWIGEIPENWEVIRLKNILICNDGGIWGEKFDDEGTVVLRSTEVGLDGSWKIVEPARRNIPPKDKKQYLLREGDLLVTKSSGSEQHIGKTAIVDKEVEKLKCVYSNFMQKLRVGGRFSPKLIYYFINSRLGKSQLQYLSTTTTGLGNISATTLNSLTLPVTSSLLEQESIATFLDYKTSQIDSLIADKQRLIELLEKKRSALITQAVTKGLDPNVPMKDSGIEWMGEIPEGWETIALNYACIINPNKSEVGAKSGLMVSFVPMENIIATGVLDYSLTRSMSDVYDGYTYFRNGDILLAKVTPCFENGNIAIARQLCNGIGFGTTELHVLRAHTGFSNRFIYYLLLTHRFKMEGIYSMYGAGGLKRIPTDFVKNFVFAYPDLHEQQSVADFLDRKTSQIDSLITDIQRSINLLEEYKQSLITVAVTGKIDVRKEVA
jgi:type I restriction enzyme S subunit